MNQQVKYPFAQAAKAADYILQLLKPHCNRIHIAGSIRRLRPDVKDIEIVCEPKKEFLQNGLFQDQGNWHTSKDFTEALMTISDLVLMGNVNGRYMKIRTNSKLCPGITLDLFMPQPDDYYRQYAIRTGSAEYAHNVIAAAWKRRGWAGVKDIGLRQISQCIAKIDGAGKGVYILNPQITNPEKPPVWNSEMELFSWLGLTYTDPEHRELNNHVNIAQ